MVAATCDLLPIVEITNDWDDCLTALLVWTNHQVSLAQAHSSLSHRSPLKRRLAKNIEVLCKSARASICAIESLVCKLA